jgi:hypothetical protein
MKVKTAGQNLPVSTGDGSRQGPGPLPPGLP